MPAPERVSCGDPERCDTCGQPMKLYAQLLDDLDAGIAYASILRGTVLCALDVWYECDACDVAESFLFLDDLGPAELAALRRLAKVKGWRIFQGFEPGPDGKPVPGPVI